MTSFAIVRLLRTFLYKIRITNSEFHSEIEREVIFEQVSDFHEREREKLKLFRNVYFLLHRKPAFEKGQIGTAARTTTLVLCLLKKVFYYTKNNKSFRLEVLLSRNVTKQFFLGKSLFLYKISKFFIIIVVLPAKTLQDTDKFK